MRELDLKKVVFMIVLALFAFLLLKSPIKDQQSQEETQDKPIYHGLVKQTQEQRIQSPNYNQPKQILRNTYSIQEQGYSFTIDIQDVQQVLETGWPFYFNTQQFESLDNLLKYFDSNFQVITCTGEPHRGKTFLIMKLTGAKLLSSHVDHTIGLSIYLDQTEKNIYIDTEGYGGTVLHEKDLINKKLMTDYFIYQTANKLAQVHMHVIDRLSNPIQDSLLQYSQKLKKDENLLILVHNFRNITSIEQIKKSIQRDILDIFDNTVLEYFNKEDKTSEYYHSIKDNIFHIIMAEEGSEAGKYYNEHSVNILKKKIQSLKTQSNSKSFIQELQNALKTNLQQLTVDKAKERTFTQENLGLMSSIWQSLKKQASNIIGYEQIQTLPNLDPLKLNLIFQNDKDGYSLIVENKNKTIVIPEDIEILNGHYQLTETGFVPQIKNYLQECNGQASMLSYIAFLDTPQNKTAIQIQANNIAIKGRRPQRISESQSKLQGGLFKLQIPPPDGYEFAISSQDFATLDKLNDLKVAKIVNEEYKQTGIYKIQFGLNKVGKKEGRESGPKLTCLL